ncbi:hypothetical protein SLS61_003847 [Didymella pomorum]
MGNNPSALAVDANLPANWTYYGCYTDYGKRKLAGSSYVDSGNMTQASCVAFCDDNGYPYAGIEYGQECYCGLAIGVGSIKSNDTECNFPCPGNASEAYALEIIVPTNTTNTTLSSGACNVTSSTDSYIVNGGFEDGLTNWTAVAYNASSSTFEIGVTNEAIEGCTALTAVPKSDSKSLSYHFQTSILLANLEPEQNYTIDISIGHHSSVSGQDANSDPKYTIRLSDNTLDYGAICGFAYAPCPLIGRNNSIYETLSLSFQAESNEETLTVYLSWYNGNFDVPLYLDGVTVKLAPEDSPAVERTASSNASSLTAAYESLLSAITTTSIIASATISTAPAPTKTPLELTCKTPEACPDRPKTEITNKTLSNSGFENGLDGWDFLPQAGNFDITLTNESFEVELHIGHPSNFTLLNGSPPWLTLSYKSAVTGDIQRRVGLCGQVELPFISGPGECEFEGKDGQLYQRYGMDTRSFYSTDGVYTNATEMDIELEIVWPVGTRNVPVYVDAMRVWEIEWGTVS